MIYTHEELQAEVERLTRNATHVQIDTEQLHEVARVMKGELTGDGTPYRSNPEASLEAVLPENNRDLLQLYLVMVSQQFLIWRRNSEGQVQAWDIGIGDQRYVGGAGIMAAHARALQQGRPILDANYLATMTMTDVADLYRDEQTGEVTLQMLPMRLAKFNEIGRVLQGLYRGHAADLLQKSGGYLFRDDGRGVIQQLQLNFPVSYFDWPFCKLAFLFSQSLVDRRTENYPATDEYNRLTRIQDMNHMEIAADYYIPLFLLRTGVFKLSPELGGRLSGQQLIERNSAMEFEFRASTIIAGQMLAEITGCSMNKIDREAWKMGYLRCRLCRENISNEELPCPYRPICVGYQEQPSLMATRWPLILTPCY